MKAINFILSVLIFSIGSVFSSGIIMVLSLPPFLELGTAGIIITGVSIVVSVSMSIFCAVKFYKWFKKHTR